MSIDGHHSSSAVLLIASDLELPSNRRVWGTGGWMKPEEREALDWLILCRLLGWRVRILHPADCDFDAVLSRASGWVILRLRT
jgi:hypothetical protein